MTSRNPAARKESELPLVITVRHNLDRLPLLDLRDEIVDRLREIGVEVDATVDGTNVFTHHTATTDSMLNELASITDRDDDEDQEEEKGRT